MSEYPWNILGIEPTTDELAIRRAYARQLKQFRPDEDPEGFANLVRAREYALQWRFLLEHDDQPITDSGADEEPTSKTETTDLPGHSEAEISQGFSSRDLGATVALAGTDRFDAQAQAAAFAATINRVRELVLGTSAETALPFSEDNRTPERSRLWEPEEWRAVLSGLGELTFEQRRALRDFVVSEAVPQLRAPPVGAALKHLLEDPGPSVVVDLWETEFGIRHDQAALAQLCGTQAMLRYLDWVALAERVPPLDKRSEAERHFIACLNELLPPRSATAAAGSAPDEAWVLDRWEELFPLVRQMAPAEATRCQDLLAERVTAWLPDLPAGPLAKLGAKAAPATIVERIEREFTLTQRLDSPFVDDAGANRYEDWLVYARRLHAIPQRFAEGENAYRTAAGIPVIPPEDLPLGVLPDKHVQAALAQAQRDGWWRPRFDPHAFFLPALSLAKQRRLFPSVSLAACEGAIWFGLKPLGTPIRLVSVTAGLLLIRLLFAFAMRPMAASAAVQRIKLADHDGLVHPKERRRAIDPEETASWLMLPITIAAFILAFFLFFFGLIGAIVELSSAIEISSSPTATQWIKSGEKNIRAYNAKDAIADFTRAIEIDPNEELAFRRRGETFLVTGNLHRAIEDFNRAVSLNPMDAEAHLKRALAYTSLNRSDLAAPDYAAVMELAPDRGKQRILTAWQLALSIYFNKKLDYPADGRNSSAEVAVTLTIDRNGHLLSKSMKKGSGNPRFDAEVLSMLDRSDPLPPPPPPIARDEESWSFDLPIIFHATSKGRR